MRGDSLRDFYAKSLALLGLAALAGIGALVDYWPADLSVPRDVARALPMPAAAPPATAVDLVALSSQPIINSTRAEVATVPAPAIPDAFPASVATSDVAVGAIDFAMSAPQPVGMAVSTASEVPATEIALSVPLPPSIPIADAEPTGVLARTVALREPSPAAANVAPVDASPAQVVTGALRWTGQSILHVGAKTGATIVDALGAFKGAFRKVPWFSSAPASRPIG